VRRSALPSAGACAAILTLGLTACGTPSGATGSGGIDVVSSDTECRLSTADTAAGTLTFQVKNEGTQVTEFYLLGSDGLRILGEAENIGPGLTRNLTLQVSPGSYTAACKPGMVGDGLREAFTVSDGAPSAAPSGEAGQQLAAAVTGYTAYVKDQAEQLLTGTKEFASAFAAGDVGEARALYAQTRMHWERIEPVAESFGDLDPRLDLREADLEPGQVWTGWHAAEKDLWPPTTDHQQLTAAQRQQLAAALVSDTQTLYDRTRTLQLQPDQLSNGAKELLDEVATGKVTGEEEIWSHTDLWDFQANVDGARVAYEELRPVVLARNPELATTLDDRFAALQLDLDKYRAGDGFVPYTQLTPVQVKSLSVAVDALGEPLSQLTPTVLS
jgi:iron uptake system component EfeO